MGRSRTLAMVVGGLVVGFSFGYLPFWVVWFVLAGALGGILAATIRLQHLARVRGWFEGRSAIYASLIEAEQRGMSPDDWLHAELERDRIFFFEHALSKRERRKKLAAESAEQGHGDGGDGDGDHQ